MKIINYLVEFIKARYKKVDFYIRIFIITSLPIVASIGVNIQDVNTWPALWEVIVGVASNPYVFFTWLFALIQSFRKTYKETPDQEKADQEAQAQNG